MTRGIYEYVKRLIHPMVSGKGLKGRVFRGGAWLGAGSLSEQAFRFGRNMLLTRLLAPEAFGTMAIALSSASIVDTLLEAGVRQAIIQNPRGAELRYLNAAWWLAMGRGLTFYSLIFAVSPLIAKFYGNPVLLPLLRVALLSVLFESAMSPRTNLAIREMRFSKWAAINHGGGILGVIFTVVLSFFVPGVWALAIGYCSENAIRCILSYIICPDLPAFGIDRDALRDLLKFSRGVFGLAFLNLIFLRTDVFVLAKLFPSGALGLYVMAIYLVQTPTSFLMNLQSQTMLPTFSEVQNDNPRVNRIFLQITCVVVLLGVPALVFLIFCGHSVLAIAYGPRYSTAASSFIVAAFVSLLSIVNGQLTLVFFAKGLPQLHRRCVLITAIAMIVLIYPLTKELGIVGAQVSCSISMFLGYVFQVERIYRLIDLDLAAYGRLFLAASLISLVVGAVCVGAQSFALFAQPLPKVLLGVTACILSYTVAAGIFLRQDQGEAA